MNAGSNTQNPNPMIKEKERTESIEVLKASMLEKGIEQCFSSFELKEYFTGKYFNRLAARLLAKELFLEEIAEPLALTAISIMNDPFGKPSILLPAGAQVRMKDGSKLNKLELSLSHTGHHARALLVFECQ
jgi:phosphopantetheinyl transferase (holo-ACP synthase)